MLLSAYSFEGKPIGDLIDPNPVMVASNYLVFRMPSFISTVGLEDTEAMLYQKEHLTHNLQTSSSCMDELDVQHI